MSDDAETIIKHEASLRTDRYNFDSWWQDIAYRVLPQEATFTTVDAEGTKRTERLFDSTAAIANERFAAVVEDLLTPRTQIWHGLKPPAGFDELLKSRDNKIWYEQARDVLFGIRYAPSANFASQKHQCYLSLGAFGNYAMFIDEAIGDRAAPARFIACHMSEIVWSTGVDGRVDTIYRKFELEARNAAKMFGEKTPAKIKAELAKDPFKKFCFIHCTKLNEERIQSRRDYRGMRWASYYVFVDDKAIVTAGGYRTWPWAVGRYMVSTREKYGRSPAMLAWPAIMTLQEEKKTVLRAGQLEVHPPVLLTEEGALEAFSLRPGALNHGLVNDQGQELAKPFKTGADVPLGMELMQLEKQDIRDAFLQTIFEVLVENPQMTATQVLEIAQSRGVLLAPTMGRLQSEDLGPSIIREMDIAAEAGKLPPLPEELLELEDVYRVEYSSPLARAQRANEALAITRTLEILPAAIAVDPNAAYVMDIPESTRAIAEINGVPAKLLRDEKQIAAIVQQKQDADQAAAVAAAAPELSQASLNAAKAESLRAGVPA